LYQRPIERERTDIEREICVGVRVVRPAKTIVGASCTTGNLRRRYPENTYKPIARVKRTREKI
jgi:hypothetical protein